MATINLNGNRLEMLAGETLLDAINRVGVELAQVCFHPQLGPIQTCDTCMVEADGKLVRACATEAHDGMNVVTESARAQSAQREAFDRILGNHLLYCTVCDNNNGNCTVHNTTALLEVEHQTIPYRPEAIREGSCRMRFIDTTRTSAFCAVVAWRRARTCR